MLKGVHFLLTYRCTLACDHCFVYSGPRARGTFTIDRLRDGLRQAARVDTVEGVFFEGGEPLLFYALLLEGLRLARELGLSAGIVTNAYWATSVGDAELCLRPLVEAGLTSMGVSDDALHSADGSPRPGCAVEAAERLGLGASLMPTQPPAVEVDEDGHRTVTGGVMFRGRAADELIDDLPTRPAGTLDECPHEDLRAPGRVHLDPYGNVHLCQGLLMGNIRRVPLPELVSTYDPDAHPICGPLVSGGPSALAERYGVAGGDACVSECHLCYEARRALRPRFPYLLGPAQVYGEA